MKCANARHQPESRSLLPETDSAFQFRELGIGTKILEERIHIEVAPTVDQLRISSGHCSEVLRLQMKEFAAQST